jgi:GPH family glycoside/pentoside/hexuronide:cation symporter
MHIAGWLPPSGSQALLIVLMIKLFVEMLVWLGLMTFIWSMYADITENLQAETGERAEGIIASGQSFIRKSAAALGTMVAGTILTLIEFPVQTETARVSEEMLTRLGISSVVSWAVPASLAAWVISKYPISRESHTREVQLLGRD